MDQNDQRTRLEYVMWMTEQGVNKTLIFVDEADKNERFVFGK